MHDRRRHRDVSCADDMPAEQQEMSGFDRPSPNAETMPCVVSIDPCRPTGTCQESLPATTELPMQPAAAWSFAHSHSPRHAWRPERGRTTHIIIARNDRLRIENTRSDTPPSNSHRDSSPSRTSITLRAGEAQHCRGSNCMTRSELPIEPNTVSSDHETSAAVQVGPDRAEDGADLAAD